MHRREGDALTEAEAHARRDEGWRAGAGGSGGEERGQGPGGEAGGQDGLAARAVRERATDELLHRGGSGLEQALRGGGGEAAAAAAAGLGGRAGGG